jgi:hypothetical protein
VSGHINQSVPAASSSHRYPELRDCPYRLATGEAIEGEQVFLLQRCFLAPPPPTCRYTETEMSPKAAAAKDPPKKCKWNEDALLDFPIREIQQGKRADNSFKAKTWGGCDTGGELSEGESSVAMRTW